MFKVFITGTQCVYCAVRTVCLKYYLGQFSASHFGSPDLIPRPVLGGICGGQSGTCAHFSQSTSSFPCQYNSTDTPSSYSCYPNLKGKRVSLWERSEISTVLEI